MIPNNDNEKQSFMLLYFAVEPDQVSKVTIDPRHDYVLGIERLTNNMIINVSFSSNLHGHLETRVGKIFFAFGATKEEAKTELKQLTPLAFESDDSRRSAFSYITMKQDVDTILLNFNHEKPSSLFQFAIEINPYNELSYPFTNTNDLSKKVSFSQLKQQIIEQIKIADVPGFFNSINKFFLSCSCFGNNKNDTDGLVSKEQQREQYLQENLFNKIESAEHLSSLYEALDAFCSQHRDSYSKVVDKITNVLNSSEFETVRSSSTLGLNNNNN